MIKKACEERMLTRLANIAERVRLGMTEEDAFRVSDLEADEAYTRKLLGMFMDTCPTVRSFTLRDPERNDDIRLDLNLGLPSIANSLAGNGNRASQMRELVNARVRHLLEIARPGDSLPDGNADIA
jgi:hypothetical protein